MPSSTWKGPDGKKPFEKFFKIGRHYEGVEKEFCEGEYEPGVFEAYKMDIEKKVLVVFKVHEKGEKIGQRIKGTKLKWLGDMLTKVRQVPKVKGNGPQRQCDIGGAAEPGMADDFKWGKSPRHLASPHISPVKVDLPPKMEQAEHDVKCQYAQQLNE